MKQYLNEATCSCLRNLEELQRNCTSLYGSGPIGHHGSKDARSPHKDSMLGLDSLRSSSWTLADPEIGQVVYTISILLMFSFVIVLLMVRSIKSSNSGVEVSDERMEALLDAMRFREELDIQERQRRRLLKAKNKVTAWLTKTQPDGNGTKGWQSSPQLIQPRKYTSSTISEIPEIVVTEDCRNDIIRRPHTPCLSLIFDFENNKNSSEDRRSSVGRTSLLSDTSGRESRLSQSLDHDKPPRISVQDHSFSMDSSDYR